MNLDKILWLDDQFEDFSSYRAEFSRFGYIVEFVASVSEAEQKIREAKYTAIIFDVKVLPGNSKKWIELDKKKRLENPLFDSYLGLELIYSLLQPDKASVKLDPPISLDPRRIIVFSVVYDKADELSAMGIPSNQIIYKSISDSTTLPRIVKQIETEFGQ